MSPSEVALKLGIPQELASMVLQHPKCPPREKFRNEENYWAKVERLAKRLAGGKGAGRRGNGAREKPAVPKSVGNEAKRMAGAGAGARGMAGGRMRPRMRGRKTKAGGSCNADLVDKLRKSRRTVREVGPSPEWIARRLELRPCGMLKDWLLEFLGEMFTCPFSEDQEKVIAKLDYAIHNGGLFAEAMPRGGGKTTIAKGAMLYGYLEGFCRFPVPIAADAASAREFIAFFKIALRQNTKVQEAYTPVTGFVASEKVDGLDSLYTTGYLAHGEGVALRYKSQLRPDGMPSSVEWSQEKLVMPSTILEDRERFMVFCAGSVIVSKGLTGGVRGLHHNLADGSVIRPDFVLLDDPQTRESAESLTQTATRERIINGDVLGLAGPTTRITAVMTCTVVRHDDLACKFLDRAENPQWQGEKMSLVYKMPAAQDTLWQEYRSIYEEAKRNDCPDDCPKEATAFYAANREAMDAGAVVAWAHRYRPGEISALQYAENQLIDMGEDAFLSEMQNAPPTSTAARYEITPEIVCSRLNRQPRLDLGNTHFSVCMADINRSGLHWVTMSSATEFAGQISAWGKYPKGKKQLWHDDLRDGIERKQAIWAGLKGLCDELRAQNWNRAGTPAGLNLVLIDCGFEMDLVFKFCAWADREYPFTVLASRGMGEKNYRLPNETKMIGKPGDGFHLTTFQGKGKVLVHNTDRWRMAAQKAFLLPTGAPGSISLYGDREKAHQYYADHVCSEKLIEHVVGGVKEYYTWAKKPGNANDLLDSTVAAMVGLYKLGCQDAGIPSAPKKQKTQRRKAKVQIGG